MRIPSNNFILIKAPSIDIAAYQAKLILTELKRATQIKLTEIKIRNDSDKISKKTLLDVIEELEVNTAICSDGITYIDESVKDKTLYENTTHTEIFVDIIKRTLDYNKMHFSKNSTFNKTMEIQLIDLLSDISKSYIQNGQFVFEDYLMIFDRLIRFVGDNSLFSVLSAMKNDKNRFFEFIKNDFSTSSYCAYNMATVMPDLTLMFGARIKFYYLDNNEIGNIYGDEAANYLLFHDWPKTLGKMSSFIPVLPDIIKSAEEYIKTQNHYYLFPIVSLDIKEYIQHKLKSEYSNKIDNDIVKFISLKITDIAEEELQKKEFLPVVNEIMNGVISRTSGNPLVGLQNSYLFQGADSNNNIRYNYSDDEKDIIAWLGMRKPDIMSRAVYNDIFKEIIKSMLFNFGNIEITEEQEINKFIDAVSGLSDLDIRILTENKKIERTGNQIEIVDFHELLKEEIPSNKSKNYLSLAKLFYHNQLANNLMESLEVITYFLNALKIRSNIYSTDVRFYILKRHHETLIKNVIEKLDYQNEFKIAETDTKITFKQTDVIIQIFGKSLVLTEKVKIDNLIVEWFNSLLNSISYKGIKEKEYLFARDHGIWLSYQNITTLENNYSIVPQKAMMQLSSNTFSPIWEDLNGKIFDFIKSFVEKVYAAINGDETALKMFDEVYRPF